MRRPPPPAFDHPSRVQPSGPIWHAAHPAQLVHPSCLPAGDYSFAFSGLQLVLKVPALIVPVDVSIGGKLTQLAYSKTGNIGKHYWLQKGPRVPSGAGDAARKG